MIQLFKSKSHRRNNRGTRRSRSKNPAAALRRTIEALEDRRLLTGSWTNLAASGSAPANGGAAMMLLSDGTVLVQNGSNPPPSADMFKLSPQGLTGSYTNGTWTDINNMNEARLFFTTAMLQNGNVFAVGGEFPNFSNTAEIFNPTANSGNGSWTYVDSAPTSDSKFGDDPIEVLSTGPNAGQVLAGYYGGTTTYRFNPSAAAGSQWTATTGGKLHGEQSDEESWVKLKDGSILTYDIFASGGGTFQAQRYIPSMDKWVDASTLSAVNPPSILESNGAQGSELGPAFLQPDGKVIYFGANGNTAIYDPNVGPNGTWSAGPQEPQKNLTVTRVFDGVNMTTGKNNVHYSVTNGGPATFLVGTDDPGVMLPNGHILISLSPVGPVKAAADGGGYSFPQASYIYEYDPVAQTFTENTPAGLTTTNAFKLNMVQLPNGQVLMSTEGGVFQVYTPDGSPQDAWRPTITSIVDNGGGTFTLKGTQLNGISEGANYGDDNQSASNYPIIKFTIDILGLQLDYYARTFNWSSAGVATGSSQVTTQFNLPSGFSSLSDFDSLVVIANGIPSASVTSAANPNVTGQTNQTADEGASKSFSLGSFNDPDGSPWSVDVDWGDGTSHTTFSESTNGSLGTQSHTYGEEGTYTATVTVTDSTSLSGSATFQVAVADLAVTPTGNFAFSAVEGALSSSQTVATFVDPGGAEPNSSASGSIISHYTATIDWGDGTATTNGSITYSGSPGSKSDSYTVSASHTYAEEGGYTVKVTINHEGKISSTSSAATVTDPAVDLSGGFGFSAVEGADSATQTVATFKDPGGAEPNSSDPGAIADHYTATIDWGDGTATSSGTISYSGTPGSKTDSFTVSADHTFGEEGTYTIKVTINHEGQITTATSTATVTDPAVDPTGGFSLLTARGAPLCDVTVATFTDPGGAEPNSFDPTGTHYTATIDWGDGTAASSADISFSGTPGSKTDSYTVSGDHVYVGNGTYTIAVTIHHEMADVVMTTSTATVKSVAIGQGPCDANTLLIGGTLAGDTIVVNPINSKTGTVQVQINNEPAVIIDGASYSSIAVYAQDGNDSVQLSGTLTRDAFLFGEGGGDRLKGGGGNNFIYGGNGNDILIADTKSDFSILIGGAGADQLNGNGGGDILIGGDVDFADPTNCDNNPKICSVLSAWIGTPGQSYSDRAAAADAVLSGHVLNDSAADTVNGGPGLDLFYASLGDVLKGNQKGETIKTV